MVGEQGSTMSRLLAIIGKWNHCDSPCQHWLSQDRQRAAEQCSGHVQPWLHARAGPRNEERHPFGETILWHGCWDQCGCQSSRGPCSCQARSGICRQKLGGTENLNRWVPIKANLVRNPHFVLSRTWDNGVSTSLLGPLPPLHPLGFAGHSYASKEAKAEAACSGRILKL